MKKWFKILLLASISSFYCYSMEVKRRKIDKETSTLYKFFNVEQFQSAPEEVKCIIAQKYGPWWYNSIVFPHFLDGIVTSVRFNSKSDKVLIGSINLTQNCIVKLFDLQGNLLRTFFPYPDLTPGGAIYSDLGGITKLLTAFDFQDQYLVTAAESVCAQKTVLRSWDLDGNMIGQICIKGTILALAFNPQGQIVIMAKSPQGFISAGGIVTAQWFDIHFNNLKTIKNPCSETGLCCSAKLDENANKALLQFDKSLVLNRFGLENYCIKYLDQVVKWDFNEEEEEYVDNDHLRFQHKNFISSVAIAPQGDKVLTSFLNEIKLWDWNGNNLVTFKHVDNPIFTSDLIERDMSIFMQLELPSVNLLEFSPDGRFILTASSHCKSARLWDLNGKNLVEFPHDKVIRHIIFNFQADKLLIGSFEKTNLWVLYKNPTLEQALLKRLIQIYLLIEKPLREIQSPETLFGKIVAYFKTKDIELDESELNYIWNTMPQEIRNSLWRSIQETIIKFGK